MSATMQALESLALLRVALLIKKGECGVASRSTVDIHAAVLKVHGGVSGILGRLRLKISTPKASQPLAEL